MVALDSGSGNKSIEADSCGGKYPSSVPALNKRQQAILAFSWSILGVTLVYILVQFCSVHKISWLEEWLPEHSYIDVILRPCMWGTYVALGLLLAMIIVIHWLRHEICVFRNRLVDKTEVLAMFVEAETVDPRVHERANNSDDSKVKNEYDKKMDDLLEEVKRLKMKVMRNEWTEYQILPLNQMLVDFLKKDDLVGRTRLYLADLEGYAEDGSCRYEWEQFYKWENRINQTIDDLNEPDDKKSFGQNHTFEKLRAELRSLLEHIAGYEMNWAEGSTIIRDIMRCGAIAVPVFLCMGLMPILHPATSCSCCDNVLGILNWGLLGTSGAITAVLLNLRKSNLVDVGDTEGKRELWRGILSAPLGLVASVLCYSFIAGKIATGAIIPEIGLGDSQNLGLSILWAIVSGFCFEKMFDRVLSATLGN